MIDHIYHAGLIILGGIIGLTFSDIDLAPVFPLKHRSAWTHGPLIPMGLVYLLGMYPQLWWFNAGFLPTFALHLAKDMFPRRWAGSAKINLHPVPLVLPALFSFLFLAGTVAYSGWLVAGMLGYV